MNKKNNFCLTAGLLASVSVGPVYAGAFEIAVSPSRLELNANTSQRLGQSLEIQNVGRVPTELTIRTLDWTYSTDGKIGYHEELMPNSCRPWVTLEKNSIKLNAQAKRSFRFQVEVPANAPRGECRFMVALEGKEPAKNALINAGGANISLPVNGRIAVAVYIAVGGSEPKLSIKQLNVQNMQGKRVPVAIVSNQGNAHGRLDGVLEASDAKGQQFELAAENTPILPGQTRTLVLTPQAIAKQKLTPPTYPISAQGSIDWDKGSFKINNAVFK
jgi:P pilus assembly chaperone PapD